MKAILVLLAVVGFSLAKPTFRDVPKIEPKLHKISPRDLEGDLEDLAALFPMDEIEDILKLHLDTDPGFDDVVIYLQNEEWATLVDTVAAKPAVQDFIQYLKDRGVPVDDILSSIDKAVHDAVPGKEADPEGSLRPFLDHLESILPLENITNLLLADLQSSLDVQQLYLEISSEDARKLVEEVRALDEVQRIAKVLEVKGVHLVEALAVVYGFLGWGEPMAYKISPRDLEGDLEGFVNLLPLKDIEAIVDLHLNTDPGFDDVVIYLKSEEWAKLVDTVAAKPAVQDFIQYLKDGGVPVDDILSSIEMAIHDAVPGKEADPEGSLRPFLDHLESILPLDDLTKLLADDLQSSLDFQGLYIEVSSEAARKLVEEVRALDEVQRLAQRLEDKGVHVHDILAVIYSFFGWGEPKAYKISPRSLNDDFQDFLNLLPLNDMIATVEEHLKSDAGFDDLIEYLQSGEWAQLVDTIAAKPAVQDFIQFLTDKGLPVENLLVFINRIILTAVRGTESDPDGSIKPFLDEIQAELPVADLVAFLSDKLQSSTDFQDLYIVVSSEKARQLVEEVRALAEVQRIAQRLRDKGANIDEALADIYAFLGWGVPTL